MQAGQLELASSCIFLLGVKVITPCCRVLLEELRGFQLVKKFPAFFITRKFIHVTSTDALRYDLYVLSFTQVLHVSALLS